jgi:hypothetical protein
MTTASQTSKDRMAANVIVAIPVAVMLLLIYLQQKGKLVTV